MQRLILLRHAEAEQNADNGDFNRALTKRGRREARLAGEVLAAQGFVPDLALVSTAVRARETWEAAAPAFPAARLELSAELYNAGPEVLLAAAQAAEADSVMLVAHNPGMHQLVIDLAGRAEALERVGRGFATAAAAVFAFEGRRPRYLGGHDPDLIR